MRTRAARVLVGLAVLLASARAAVALGPISTNAEGTWVGRCEMDGRVVFLRLRMENGRRGRGNVQVRALSIARAAAADVAADGDQLALTFPGPSGPVRLSGKLAAGTFQGTAESGGKHGAFSLRKRFDIDEAKFDPLIGNYELAPDNVVLVGRWDETDFMFLMQGDRRIEIVPVGPREFVADDLRSIHFELDHSGKPAAAVFTTPGKTPVRARRVQLYDEERVVFQNGGVRLAGSLLIPPGAGPHPALVFVHGSGPQTRESDRIEADRFARGGVACLFYDKRGTGESGGDWQTVGFEALAHDVLAGVSFLGGHPRIAADKIGLWGVSQAGWIIPLAAAKSKDVAFIVPVSGGAVTPAEQEAWRRRQNLVYLGVSERFIEAGRKAAVMTFEWQRGNQTGAMPLVNPFATDDLNMYHNAAAAIAKVRQPTLVIFGGLDTLGPPREGAAIWADALRQSGNRDFSVRLFPHGTHGLSVGGKTGVRFEITPEVRWVPGYWDTMLAWIRHHTGGAEFADARRVDAEPGPIPVEARGMHALGWYGSGVVQPWLLLGLMVVFASAVLALPVGWLWRVIFRRAAPDSEARGTARLAVVSGVWILAIMFALVYVLHQIADAEPHAVLENVATIWNVLVGATWISLVAGALFLRRYVAAWGAKKLSRAASVYYAVVGLAVMLWVPFVYYWNLLLPAR